MDTFNIYWSFMNRTPTSSSTTGIEVLPNLLRDTVFYSVLFSLVFSIITPIMSAVFSKSYVSLPERKKQEVPSYIVCLLHHFVAVPFAWQRVYSDFNLLNEAVQTIDYAVLNAVIAPWCIAYLITDSLFFAIPEATHGKFSYIIHHFLVITLVISSLYGPGSILRYIPHLLISDTTNIFFNTAWLLRLTGRKDSLTVTFLEICFTISFFFVRTMHMPILFWVISSQSEILGFMKFCFVPIVLLQWYWFYKIARIIIMKILKRKQS
jgi:hypothetical protein